MIFCFGGSMNPLDSVDKTINRIPFALAFLAPLFSGSLFTTLNLPLLYILVQGRQFGSFYDLLTNGLFPIWDSFLQSPNLLNLTAIIFVGFVSGLIMAPVERLSSTAIAEIYRHVSKHEPFSSFRMSADDYPDLLSWLFAHPAQKAHWEWELFHHYLYWSVSVNLGITFVLSIVFLWQELYSLSNLILAFVFLSILGLTIGFSLVHARLMERVHQMYLKEVKSMKNS
jgi:hypothetical protein